MRELIFFFEILNLGPPEVENYIKTSSNSTFQFPRFKVLSFFPISIKCGMKIHIVGLYVANFFFFSNSIFMGPQKSSTQLKPPKILESIIMLGCRRKFGRGTTLVLNLFNIFNGQPGIMYTLNL